jgi:hypothetical protein
LIEEGALRVKSCFRPQAAPFTLLDFALLNVSCYAQTECALLGA